MLGGLSANKTFFAATGTSWRDYGVLTILSIELIAKITQAVGAEFVEVDINQAYPKLLYSLAGVDFPTEDFYGGADNPKRYKNKISVNVAVNNSFYDITKGSNKSRQRLNKYNRLVEVGFDAKVADYALSVAFDKSKSEMFNILSSNEKIIIDQLKKELKRKMGIECNVHRRHDSVLIFNSYDKLNDNDGLARLLQEFKYRGETHWFKDIGFF
jgi:hypothetical protein